MMKKISRSQRLVALAFVVALPLGALLFSGGLTAQQPPPPTEKPPSDLVACCQKMEPGGLTIAGPGNATATPDSRQDLFYQAMDTRAVQVVCVTVENTSTFVAHVSLTEDDVLFVQPGAIKSACRRSGYISLRCPDGPCQVRWRVDRALN